MVLLPALPHVFLLSLDKNDSMDCCRFIVSGKQQMRNDTRARKENHWSSVLRSTSQQLNKLLRDKSFVYLLFFHILFLYLCGVDHNLRIL